MEKELKIITKLLQQLLAIELQRSGIPQGEIAKRLHLNLNNVNELLKGTKKVKPE